MYKLYAKSATDENKIVTSFMVVPVSKTFVTNPVPSDASSLTYSISAKSTSFPIVKKMNIKPISNKTLPEE
ncbi:hypothetical protein [Catalinimonas niigatensis]|uniref:hypothetical protein n=1 Tax=Catalinimonas niigatensis TaxID=1397264 RepID=UPI00266548EE|nr:hypothetical protein [Catalinimonas niigatensis]WPP48013.1 hypothetical protein PZB72_15145 [Catalinimonas niigatensis]